ncbi:MAG: hypothetical protein DBX40_05480 [Clostridiales bacterium]|nr:MAG: hypothetical protein DBX40_05480 [Clostridiales bacterium]
MALTALSMIEGSDACCASSPFANCFCPVKNKNKIPFGLKTADVSCLRVCGGLSCFRDRTEAHTALTAERKA